MLLSQWKVVGGDALFQQQWGYHCSAIQHNLTPPPPCSSLPTPPKLLPACFVVTLQLPAVLNQSLTAVAKYGASCPPSPYQTFSALPSRILSKRDGGMINVPVTLDDESPGYRLSVIWAGCQGADCQRTRKSATIRRWVIYDTWFKKKKKRKTAALAFGVCV